MECTGLDGIRGCSGDQQHGQGVEMCLMRIAGLNVYFGAGSICLSNSNDKNKTKIEEKW